MRSTPGFDTPPWTQFKSSLKSEVICRLPHSLESRFMDWMLSPVMTTAIKNQILSETSHADSYFKPVLVQIANTLFSVCVPTPNGRYPGHRHICPLVKHDNRSIFQDSPCQSDGLILAAEKISSAAAYNSIKSIGKPVYELPALCHPGNPQYLLTGSGRSGSPNIL